MQKVFLSDEITAVCPELCVLLIECAVRNSESDERLWKEIDDLCAALRDSVKIEEVNKFLPIQATRNAYKKCGKDPNRYRPSAEALRRRILKGLDLYKVDTLVDLINKESLESGFSIGGFDAGKIEGDLVLGIGKEGELYHGIGRGVLNIAGLPVYRDAVSGIGTPTSDEERTKISLETNRLLMIINGYSGMTGLVDSGKRSVSLLKKYASATDFVVRLLRKESVAEAVKEEDLTGKVAGKFFGKRDL